jgi:hypothetical protein
VDRIRATVRSTERCKARKAGTQHRYIQLCLLVRKCPRQDSNLRTRLRRPVPNAHPSFPSALQSQIRCLQPPLASLVDPSSSHEPLHGVIDDRQPQLSETWLSQGVHEE